MALLREFYNEGKIEDPAILGVSIFNVEEAQQFIEGTKTQFRNRISIFVVFLIMFVFLFKNTLPDFIEILLLFVVVVSLIEFLFLFFKSYNKVVKKKGVFGLLFYIFSLLCLLVLLGLFL